MLRRQQSFSAILLVFRSVLVLTLATKAAWAQVPNIAGLWRGTISHGTDGFSPTWKFTVLFEQKGTRLSGNVHLEARDQFVRFALEGQVKDNRVRTTEGAILEQDSSRMPAGWCLNRIMELTLVEPNRLEGTWSSRSSGCTNGQVLLTREQPTCSAPETRSYRYLYPVSPYQYSKEYREEKSWSADPSKTPMDSEECKTKTTQRGTKPRCLYTYRHYRHTMSAYYAYYITDTNELVKAVWVVEFSERDENVQTLAIKGTSIFGDPHAGPQITDALQTVPGDTYRVGKQEFSCFEQLSKEERSRAQEEMRKAKGDPNFTKKGDLYVRKPSR